MEKIKPIIYHKSSCITCKRTLSEVQRIRLEVEKRDFFKEPFSEEELRKIIKNSGKKPQEFLRKRDKMYKELNLENKKISEKEIIVLMVKNPCLIKRPIFINQNKTLVGKIDSKDLK